MPALEEGADREVGRPGSDERGEVLEVAGVGGAGARASVEEPLEQPAAVEGRDDVGADVVDYLGNVAVHALPLNVSI